MTNTTLCAMTLLPTRQHYFVNYSDDASIAQCPFYSEFRAVMFSVIIILYLLCLFLVSYDNYLLKTKNKKLTELTEESVKDFKALQNDWQRVINKQRTRYANRKLLASSCYSDEESLLPPPPLKEFIKGKSYAWNDRLLHNT